MKTIPSRKRAAVIIPLYKASLSSSEEFSVRNTLHILSNYDIFIIGPDKLGDVIDQYKKINNFNFKVALFKDKFFKSVDGYNRLLMSKFF